MPNAIVLKLQNSGEKMTADQWAALPPAARQRLLHVPAETLVERTTYASLVRWLVRTFHE